jgi:PAS domain S-box-containing protein
MRPFIFAQRVNIMKGSFKQVQSKFNAPLMSWDIFISYYHQSLKMGTDAQQLEKLAEERHWQHQWNFSEKLFKEHKLIIVTDVERNVVFVSSNVWEITGYSSENVVGKNLAEFRNKASNALAMDKIRAAISARGSFESDILNYTPSGSPYRCRIEGHPVFNQQGALVNFIFFEKLL